MVTKMKMAVTMMTMMILKMFRYFCEGLDGASICRNVGRTEGCSLLVLSNIHNSLRGLVAHLIC